MAGRPAKSLLQHLREGSFRARRDTHRALLLGPAVPFAGFALLQQRYQQAGSEPERRAIALEFEQAVNLVHAQASRTGQPSFASEIALLGKPDSSAQLLGFFPHYLAHPKGPRIGQPLA